MVPPRVLPSEAPQRVPTRGPRRSEERRKTDVVAIRSTSAASSGTFETCLFGLRESAGVLRTNTEVDPRAPDGSAPPSFQLRGHLQGLDPHPGRGDTLPLPPRQPTESLRPVSPAPRVGGGGDDEDVAEDGGGGRGGVTSVAPPSPTRPSGW